MASSSLSEAQPKVQLLELMACTDQILALETELQAVLREGRMAIAFSKVSFGSSFVPISMAYVPKEIEPAVLLDGYGSCTSFRIKQVAVADGQSAVQWFGLNASPSVHKAKHLFATALELCVQLAAARQKLLSYSQING
jgi:hypothetical protein